MSAAREWEIARALADRIDQWGHTAAEALRIPTLIDTAAAQLRQDDWDVPAQIDDPLRDLTVAILALAGWDESGLTDEIQSTERDPDEILWEAQTRLARQVTRLIVQEREVRPIRPITTLGTVMRGIATARAAREVQS